MVSFQTFLANDPQPVLDINPSLVKSSSIPELKCYGPAGPLPRPDLILGGPAAALCLEMSPTDRKIRALLEKASSTCDPPLVEEAFRLVCKLSAADSGVAPDAGKGYSSPELAVLVAEVAVELSSPDRTEDAAQHNRNLMNTIADEASKLFRSISNANNQVFPKILSFLRILYVKNLCLKKSANQYMHQFMVRTLLVQATLIQRGATGRRGAGLTDQISKAIELVMRALEIAVAEPRYKFLVYNTSVVFWRVSRPLQRQGRFSAIVEQMQRVADAVRELGPDDTEWKARFWIGLARAYDDCERPDDAIRVLQVRSGPGPRARAVAVCLGGGRRRRQ